MGYADISVCFGIGDSSIIGSFIEKDYDHLFEFSANLESDTWGAEFPHKIWLSDGLYRYGTVKKTVAYIVTDEDKFGKPVIEKWKIKDHRVYTRAKVKA